MKDKSGSSHLKNAKSLTGHGSQDEALKNQTFQNKPKQEHDPLHLSTFHTMGQSVSQVNRLFMAWLEALGKASAGQADEHVVVQLEKHKSQ